MVTVTVAKKLIPGIPVPGIYACTTVVYWLIFWIPVEDSVSTILWLSG